MVAPAFNLTVMKPLSGVVLGSQTANLMGNTNALTDPQPGVKSPIAGAGYIVLDAGGQAWQQVFVGYTTANGASNVRMRASTAADGITSTPFDVTAFPGNPEFGGRPSGYRHFLLQAPNPVNERYIRLDFVNAMDIGVLAVGAMIQPEYNSDYGETSWGYEEAADPDLLDSGVEVLYDNTPAPVFNFQLSWLTKTEMERDWEPLGRLQHTGTPVIVCRDPSDANGGYGHNGIFYGRLRMRPIVAQDFDMYEVQGQIRSMV